MERSTYLLPVIISALLVSSASITSSELESSALTDALVYIKETVQQNKVVSGALALTPAVLCYLCSTHNDKAIVAFGLAMIGLTAWAVCLTGSDFPAATHPPAGTCFSTNAWPLPGKNTSHPANSTTAAPENKPFLTCMAEHFVDTMDQFS